MCWNASEWSWLFSLKFLVSHAMSIFVIRITGNQSQRNHLVMDHGSPGKQPQHARNTFLRISAWTKAQDLSAGRDESGQVELFEKFQIFDTGIIAMSVI